ncbi:MAG: hypothetical protein JSW35_02725 [Deltaproteobacteria bacterium]|nr:MAG: hypothetical protein JSW35_02725 [Deltaproteobacteria bacterium]
MATNAVGLPILKVLGSNDAIMNWKILEQEQTERAVELGLGASSPSEIDIVSTDRESHEYCKGVRQMLMRG